MIVDGRQLAREVLEHARTRAARLSHPPTVLAFVANETAATKSYLSIKKRRAAEAGCVLTVVYFPETVTTEELCAAVGAADADAVLVQLPLPASIDTQRVCDAIRVEKDADVLSTLSRAAFAEGSPEALLPPVVSAVQKILAQTSVTVRGAQVTVVGEGFLVGKPVATWFRQKGAHVQVATSKTANLEELLRSADIVVSGAGVPNLITPHLLRDGVVLIDAGTAESSGKIVGDATEDCAEKAAVFTPVPGGVGPLAVACLFENAVLLAERQCAS